MKLISFHEYPGPTFFTAERVAETWLKGGSHRDLRNIWLASCVANVLWKPQNISWNSLERSFSRKTGSFSREIQGPKVFFKGASDIPRADVESV